MKKISNELINYIKSMSESVLFFGEYNDKILDTINENKKIINCDILSSENKVNSKSQGKNKIIYIKDLRKKYKKKKLNYIVGDIKQLDKYKRTFVKDSIYINKKTIYLYCDNEYENNYLIKMYKRYNTKIDILSCIDGKIIIIDTSSSKTNIIKDIFYSMIDFLIKIYDFIGDMLIG
ncbi:MAG: hypothetical protein PHN42_02085 [Bacilli bacterium]|nr:hypothetical protein [Bacilli bacterium]